MALLGVMEKIIAQGLEKKYPMLVAVTPMVKLGALAAMQYSWARAGEMCAEKADMIFRGTPAKSIPITAPDKVELSINLAVAEKLGIQIPFEWIEMANESGLVVEQ